MTISGHKSMTDWDRVKRDQDSNAPISFEPTDGPYDPNDEAATEAYMQYAAVWAGWPNPVLVKVSGKPVTDRISGEDSEAEAKAS